MDNEKLGWKLQIILKYTRAMILSKLSKNRAPKVCRNIFKITVTFRNLPDFGVAELSMYKKLDKG